MDKENDLPAWYSLDNPRVRVLPLPKPDHSIRRHIIKTVGPIIPGFADLEPESRESMVSQFGDQTGGLFAGEIISIGRLAAADKLEFTKIAEAVRRYKLGIPDNPWDKLDRDVIENAPAFMAGRVVGQDKAVEHSLDIVKRSVFDLSGAQFSQTAQRPKGVMFLAGPTGVGKTELAKSLAELIFGSTTNYIRFDMSEFNQEHANQRLVGAPPGYVGYDVGGELTNAVKQNPFSLILFDEIEKAHPKLMDIFLQILDDGRLTSGRGETVYFSDALIIFTSNLGVYQAAADGRRELRIKPDMEYPAIHEEITAAISDFFNSRLNRPEILNRLGPNIVVFDFIRPREAGRIFQKMLANILGKLRDSHKIALNLETEDQELLSQLSCRDLSMGGRGIGNALEEAFVNPLARALFKVRAKAGESYTCRFSPGSDGKLILSLDKVG
jgi:ATP-dependent Clp protease ATP-binding subunit ClpA